ncbi:phage baseplate plug family protein [Roseibium alexandrii]|uniref:Cyanophage baseplate Pam3 plug gp18 domain-containing protein n=1 Tax=Roseibium alexandrii TaxID=388408 RepID=A0A0M6ZWG1_9HYPH|nr:hypothetical protein [Roseibium alexandrii]CTQ67109.1 hypothetical protein LAX5112_01216 [Roseibium alexandrii]
MIRIFLTDNPRQQLSVLMGQRRTTLVVWYSDFTKRWSFDLAVDDAPVLTGRRIVAGVDLLKPFDLGLGVLFVDAAENPSRNSFIEGTAKLYHATQAEIDAALAA